MFTFIIMWYFFGSPEIHRTQYTAHNSSRHNSPRTIQRAQFAAAQFTTHNSPQNIKIPLDEFLILLDIC
jgi:hypothetical protein